MASLLTDKEIKVAIVDDHEAIRVGFKGACQEYGLKLVASAATVQELLDSDKIADCEVVVLDLSLADGSIVTDNVQALLKTGAEVVIFSIGDKKNMVRAALRAGAAALVRKSQSMEELARTIRLIATGLVVNNTETSAVIDADTQFKDEANLSPREREVLSLYASGFALKQVATELDISISTAKEHIDRVRAKYSGVGRTASTKTDLLIRAIEDGIIEESSM
ncbi:response regulator transcription factor [Rhodoluna sp.]|jgi:DNA-binding NarL/FixJ family response regulator|uniref:response regulator transcription factor n=1 Tax=Rhodoluna sp. TaxID=1969481 RepID=UPI0025EEA004|nr:response regulator transcription factor [Rhodoluna sp.]